MVPSTKTSTTLALLAISALIANNPILAQTESEDPFVADFFKTFRPDSCKSACRPFVVTLGTCTKAKDIKFTNYENRGIDGLRQYKADMMSCFCDPRVLKEVEACDVCIKTQADTKFDLKTLKTGCTNNDPEQVILNMATLIPPPTFALKANGTGQFKPDLYPNVPKDKGPKNGAGSLYNTLSIAAFTLGITAASSVFMMVV